MTVNHSVNTSSILTVNPLLNIEELKREFSGEIIVSSDERYSALRRTQNLAYDRYPAVIVRPACTEDVAAAVRFARAASLPIAVRSGGHGLTGAGSADDALVVDLSRLKAVTIDAGTARAKVQAGATSRDLMVPAHAYGLAVSTGDTGSVGLGGLITGGGIGYMVRKHGLTIDSVLSATVVTAEGDVLTASPDQHADLFWAIRGGGGNFGIVTEFELQMVRVGSVYGGGLVLPASAEVIRGILDYAAAAPEELTVILNVMAAPPAPFIPEEKVGSLVAFALMVYLGDDEAGARAVQPLRDLAAPIADLVGPTPYPAIYDFMQMAEAPIPAVVRSSLGHVITDEAIQATLDAFATSTSPLNIVQFRILGGAMGRVPADETAFANRDKQTLTAVIGQWFDEAPEAAAPHLAWVQSLFEVVRRGSDGAYVNFLGEEGDARIRQAYPGATFDRLRAIKQKYDPANVWRFNQNIRPAWSMAGK